MNILIIGGGISGISAAKVLLKTHHKVTIVEKSEAPGGLMEKIANCRIGFKTFYDEIRDDPNLTVIKGTCVIDAERVNGSFKIHLEGQGHIDADRIIISSGLVPYDPKHLKGKRIITSLEYDAMIDQKNVELPEINKIAFVLCVGSRGNEYPLCSSVCCSYSLREIKWTLQRIKPEITVFYNDLRFFGQEFYMEKVFRDAGVNFIRANSRYFDEDENGVTIRYYNDNRIIEDRFDYVVLSIGLHPNPELKSLSEVFGFTLNEYGFIKEVEPLKTDIEGIYVSGGALEPMNIKDAILTGFGASSKCLSDLNGGFDDTIENKISYEDTPDIDNIPVDLNSYLFYLGIDDPSFKMFYEFLSESFINIAQKLCELGKNVCIVTQNLVMPSYGELLYENARRKGVIFVHLEEGQSLKVENSTAYIHGQKDVLSFSFDKMVSFNDYIELFKNKEFLFQYRTEPQIRWNPTKWDRKHFFYGFCRYPRSERWKMREYFGAVGEVILDMEEERVYPTLSEERCSGCGSCRDACPQSAIEMIVHEKPLSVFGPNFETREPIAHIKEDVCVGCGLCASVCPSDVISYEVPFK